MKIISFLDSYEMLFWVDTDIELTDDVENRLGEAIYEIYKDGEYDEVEDAAVTAIERVFGEDVRCGQIMAELSIDLS